MKLMLNYEDLIHERMLEYIREEFSAEIEESLRRALRTWDAELERAKNNIEQNTDG